MTDTFKIGTIIEDRDGWYWSKRHDGFWWCGNVLGPWNLEQVKEEYGPIQLVLEGNCGSEPDPMGGELKEDHFPVGTVIVDKEGDVWEKFTGTYWKCNTSPELKDNTFYNISTLFGVDHVRYVPKRPERDDAIERPDHYVSHPSGIEPIQITKYESFLRGNVIKYLMRAPYKGDELGDLKKALRYLKWEIERVEREIANTT